MLKMRTTYIRFFGIILAHWYFEIIFCSNKYFGLMYSMNERFCQQSKCFLKTKSINNSDAVLLIISNTLNNNSNIKFAIPSPLTHYQHFLCPYY
nr:unnamed protein product [Callosobruchus chinensis]